MDPATIVGVVLGFVAVFGTQILEGGSPMSILLIPPLFLVFVGTVGAALASNTHARDASAAIKRLVDAMTAKKSDPEAVVDRWSSSPSGPGARACSPSRTRSRRSTTPS